MEFADVARELLLVAPADFVRERTARQRAVRAEDRPLSTRIGGLRKPTPAAWVVDLLAHDGALDEAVALGPSIRRAQAEADPDAIRQLRRQRSDVVDALARVGADRAAEAGHPVTRAVLDQVRATVEAATADPHAAAAVRSGLLVRALESAGFEPVDLDGALADPDAVPEAWSGADAEPIPITSARRSRRAGRAASARQQDQPDEQHEHDQQDEQDEQDEPGHQHDQQDEQDEPGHQHDQHDEQDQHDQHGRPRRDGPGAAPRTDPSADRRAAREAEDTARAESRAADAALDAAESDLERAEERRADLERRLADASADVDRAERARDAAADASDRARDLLRAAQRHRRDVGR